MPPVKWSAWDAIAVKKQERLMSGWGLATLYTHTRIYTPLPVTRDYVYIYIYVSIIYKHSVR